MTIVDWLLNCMSINLSISSVGHLFHIGSSKSVPGPRRRCFADFDFANVLRATAACDFSTSEVQKVARACGVLGILTCKCASRHSGASFFDIGTTKIGPELRCFVHFDLQMCFAPQQRTIFPDQNIKNWSEPVVFCAFWLENALRATAACHFSFLCWPATSAPAALPSLLFEHPEPRTIEKTQRFATFLTFRACVSSF